MSPSKHRVGGRVLSVAGSLAGSVAIMLPLVWAAPAASAGTASSPSVLSVAQIDRQDIAPQPTSEPDTLVEPDVAVSPVDSHVAVAVAHDGRFSNGGAVDISYAWTRDGSVTWQHAPVPGLTKAVGGSYDRASDPVVQYASDGTAYLSTLLFAAPPGCPTAVAVSRSSDGGATWGPPVLVHRSASCDYSDDKDWLVIDSSPASPHRGRLYQFWTPFITRSGVTTSPQALRYSDDQGMTWSRTFLVNPVSANTQDSQPMIRPDGTIVDTYQNFGPARIGGDSPNHPMGTTPLGPASLPTVAFDARTSSDGGMTWGPETVITNDVNQGPVGVRCCLPGAGIDAATGRMYTVWEGTGPRNIDPVELSSSLDGRAWSTPVRVSQGDQAGIQRVNVAVAAEHGHVFVSYGTRTRNADYGGFVQQQLSSSADDGTTWAAPLSLGPVSALQYAAEAGGDFPGDYIGAAVTTDRLYLVWCRSSKPPTPSKYHQTMWAAVLTP